MATLNLRAMTIVPLFSFLLISCEILYPPTVAIDHAFTVFLRIENQTNKNITISMEVDLTVYETKVFTINSKKSYLLKLHFAGKSDKPNERLDYFNKLSFYHQKSDDKPYIEYNYTYHETGGENYWRKIGTKTRVDLYKSSPDRPFYLQKDLESKDHGFLYITSVP